MIFKTSASYRHWQPPTPTYLVNGYGQRSGNALGRGRETPAELISIGYGEVKGLEIKRRNIE